MSASLLPESETALPEPRVQVALVGNPNAGKTLLFNALTGLRARTANFPGITVDVRVGRLRFARKAVEVVDLPGLYSLDGITPEEQIAVQALEGGLPGRSAPDAILLVLDATNLERNLFLASAVLDLRCPTVVALNLMDAAKTAGIEIDVDRLSRDLKCPVVPVSARTGAGIEQLKEKLDELLAGQETGARGEHVSCTAGCSGCQFVARYDWAELVAQDSVQTPETYGRTTEKIDRILTQPVVGVAAFLVVMLAVFYLIFSLAGIPMGLIEDGFVRIAGVVDRLVPAEPSYPAFWVGGAFACSLAVFWAAYRLAGIRRNRLSIALAALGSAAVSMLPMTDFRGLLIDGVIGGVGGVLVFLPQICILFFFIAVLEDSGYLARAAFVMERVMRGVGLPGKAFVPMLAAHACAIPGIMATRVIENWRDRLVTILVLPLMTCSARLPVYTMVVALLFPSSAVKAALVFLAAYLLGIVAALLSAYCLKRTILQGDTAPLVLELPPYRMPSLRNALMTVFDRATIFVRRAGTVILPISVVLWVLATYPKLPANDLVAERGAALAGAGSGGGNETVRPPREDAERLLAQEQLAYSFAGRAGRAAEPIFRPLGFDWKMNVGVISSFAAREVIVSTLAIIYGVGEDAAENEATLTETLRAQTHADGSPVYTTATCLSLLVFYVLAMQCLPTQAVTYRETGAWKWPALQLGYMTAMAYVAALVVYQVAARFG